MIEFFQDSTNCFKKIIYFKMEDSEWTEFSKLTPEQIEHIFSHLLKFRKTRQALLHLSKYHPGNKPAILQQFIHCNWIKLDSKMDITDTSLNFENIGCPFKGTGKCPFNGEGLICIKGNDNI